MRAGAPLWLAVAAMSAAGPAAGESLSDAITVAYRTSPALLAARAEQRALDESLIQARAGLGPTISVTAQGSDTGARVPQPASLFSPATTVFDRAVNGTGQLTANQPLYAGGQLSSAISAANADVLAGRQSLRQQEATVINQVIAAYADVLQAQAQMAIADQNIQILRQHVKEIDVKAQAQALTRTDQAQAAARLLAAMTQQTQARRVLADARDKYLTTVGQSPGQLEPLPDLPGVPPDLEAAMDAAERANPQLLQASFTELGSRARVSETKASDGLTISLSASLSQEPLAPYLANQSAQAASVAIVLNKPLFASGLHTSKVRQAMETHTRDDLRLADAQRQVMLAVGQAWNDLASQRAQLKTLAEQVAQELKAFSGEQIEERVGLRTTIELLNSEQELQGAKQQLVQAYRDEYLARVSLLSAAGLLQAELLLPDLETYKPQRTLASREAIEKFLPWETLVQMIDQIGLPRNGPSRLASDPMGDLRPRSIGPMPAAPRWTDLASFLSSSPTKE